MSASVNAALESVHDTFQSLLPKLETHAAIYFRHVRCPNKKADYIAECVALAWGWLVRLHQRGKDVRQFTMVFVYLVARAVRNGRRLCGQERANDVLSGRAQQRRNFRVESLPVSTRRSFDDFYASVHGQQSVDSYEERLHDNSVTPPPDAAAFRIDWPNFLKTLSERDRELAHFLSLGHAASKAAERFKLTPGRVTQLRQRWCREWRLCQGEEDVARQEAVASA
jgi:hypothetical protein